MNALALFGVGVWGFWALLWPTSPETLTAGYKQPETLIWNTEKAELLQRAKTPRRVQGAFPLCAPFRLGGALARPLSLQVHQQSACEAAARWG